MESNHMLIFNSNLTMPEYDPQTPPQDHLFNHRALNYSQGRFPHPPPQGHHNLGNTVPTQPSIVDHKETPVETSNQLVSDEELDRLINEVLFRQSPFEDASPAQFPQPLPPTNNQKRQRIRWSKEEHEEGSTSTDAFNYSEGFPNPPPQGHSNVEYDYDNTYWKSASTREMVQRLLSSYVKCKSGTDLTTEPRINHVPGQQYTDLENTVPAQPLINDDANDLDCDFDSVLDKFFAGMKEPTLMTNSPAKVSQPWPEFNHHVFTTNHALKYSEDPFLPVKLPQHSPPTKHGHREQKKQRSRWSKEEHLLLMEGITKFGKGHWKSISTHILPTKSHIQIASHAQKLYLRQSLNGTDIAKKKRKSIHDLTADHIPDPK